MAADFTKKGTQRTHHLAFAAQLNLERICFSFAGVIKTAELIIWKCLYLFFCLLKVIFVWVAVRPVRVAAFSGRFPCSWLWL